jgi:hypothetical protein
MPHAPFARAVTVALLVLASPFAHAQAQGSTGELRDRPYEHRFAIRGGLYVRSEAGETLAVYVPQAEVAIGLVRPSRDVLVQLDLDWRLTAYTFSGSGGSSALRAFNPYVGVRVGYEDGEEGSRLRIRGGGGLTLPFANLYDADAVLVLTLVSGLALTGAWDPWLSAVGSMGLVGRGDVEYRHTYVLVGGEAALAALIPVEYMGYTGDTVMVTQLGFFVAGRPIPELAIGARLQAVGVFSTGSGGGSEGYLALAPFIRAEIGPGFIETRLFMNLDDPYGFAFDDGKFWAWSFAAGGAFD